MMKTRLNKFLVLCGLGSRRKVEEFIISGRIKINDKTTSNLAIMINPEKDDVKFDNKKLKPIDKFQYLVLNKPSGYITSLHDEKNRPIVMDIIPEKYKRIGVFPVGRLDKDTEGLLLFTNDGNLAHMLNHPKFKIAKEYIVEINNPLENSDKDKIEKGLYLHQIKVKTRASIIKILDNSKKIIKITITEGKKRQIRYTFLNLGYKVLKLKRTSYGPLKLTGINRGSYRALKSKEIKQLLDIVNGNRSQKPGVRSQNSSL